MIRYLITDGTAREDTPKWLARVGSWLERGIDIVQIRERDLNARQLAELTRRVMGISGDVRILVNDRADVAVASGAHGVHLRDGSAEPEYFSRLGLMVSVSCHSAVEAGRFRGANFVLLAPIFRPLSKTDDRPPLGLAAIRDAVRLTKTPILALGGVTASNAEDCVEAGAAGIAGISLFS